MSDQANKLSADIIENLLNEVDRLQKFEQLGPRVAELQNFLNQVIPAFKSGDITPDRIQILENGDLRILPPPPVDAPITEVCVQEPKKNGQKPDKALSNAS
jgi:hypothetical protein|tara:strand:- start:158 stop:460 length:303 start_codon:yes stop_codon:yes gene_type:complete